MTHRLAAAARPPAAAAPGQAIAASPLALRALAAQALRAGDSHKARFQVHRSGALSLAAAAAVAIGGAAATAAPTAALAGARRLVHSRGAPAGSLLQATQRRSRPAARGTPRSPLTTPRGPRADDAAGMAADVCRRCRTTVDSWRSCRTIDPLRS